MPDALEIWEKPEAKEISMIAGWRQWADAGSVSSGLPQYVIQQTSARPIGVIHPHGFYIFQIPGTHDLVRPVVKFNEGYPESLETQRNEIFYTGDSRRGLVIFLGDEPHLDIERYTDAFLQAAKTLGVKRIIGFGGVYGELPYDKERLVSSTYSLPGMKEELSRYAVTLSDYEGGASIGSYICKQAGEQGMEYASFYAFVPTYDFSSAEPNGSSVRVENDFMAWLGVLRRTSHMLKLELDLTDLEEKSQKLVELMDAKMDEIDQAAPQLGLREYFKRLSEDFPETSFNPLDEIWEDEIRRLLDKFDPDES